MPSFLDEEGFQPTEGESRHFEPSDNDGGADPQDYREREHRSESPRGGGRRPYEQKDNDGVAFINDRKESDRDPDFRGHCLVGGKKYAVYIRKKVGSNSGKEFLTLGFREWRDDPR